MDWTGVAYVVLAVVLVASLLIERRGRASGRRMPSVPPELSADVVQTISDLVTRDRRVQAIKVLREATGLGLRESKEWVDAWQPGGSSSPPTSAPSAQGPDREALATLDADARQARQQSGAIAAIKLVRTRTGWGLAEAKAHVDRLV